MLFEKLATNDFAIYRIPFVLIASWLALHSPAFAETSDKPKGQLIAGKIVGTTVGFGVGHLILQDWSTKGWAFTGTQVIGSALINIAAGKAGTHANAFTNDVSLKHLNAREKALYYSGLGLFLGSRLWEIVDLWSNYRLPASPDEASRVNPPSSQLAIGLTPIFPTSNRWGGGLALHSRF